MYGLAKASAILLAGATMMTAGSARATCVDNLATYQGGAYGAGAVTHGYCYYLLDQAGGQAATEATASSVNAQFSTYATASATLSSGAIAVYSGGGTASASYWDTVTYFGLPTGGSAITATLTLPGSLAGYATGQAHLAAGTEAELSNGVASNTISTFGSGNPKPDSISLTFNVVNGQAETIFAEIDVSAGSPDVADLADPPTLSLTKPDGSNVETASGVFVNFTPAGVPELRTWSMLALGFAVIGVGGRRAARKRAVAG